LVSPRDLGARQIEMLMHILELEIERNLQQGQNVDDPLIIHIIES
jgi:hypothetical protein